MNTEAQDPLSHDELVQLAAAYACTTLDCGPSVIVEQGEKYGETPDVFGVSRTGRFSLVIECKASTDDFRADLNKPWRDGTMGGVGERRWYLAEPGIIPRESLPEGWGLLHVQGGYVVEDIPALRQPNTNKVREVLLMAHAIRIGATNGATGGTLRPPRMPRTGREEASTEFLTRVADYVREAGEPVYASEAVKAVGHNQKTHKRAADAVATEIRQGRERRIALIEGPRPRLVVTIEGQA